METREILAEAGPFTIELVDEPRVDPDWDDDETAAEKIEPE